MAVDFLLLVVTGQTAMESTPDWVTLTDGEEVVWSSPPALFPYLTTMAMPLLLLVAGLVVFVVPVESVLPVDATVPGIVRLGATGVLAVAGLLGVTVEVLRWRSRRFLVTTEEVYHKQGLISRDVTNVRLEQIQNTTYTQSVLGRLLSYGDVRITTAGTDRSEVVFRKVADPGSVVAEITRQLDEQ